MERRNHTMKIIKIANEKRMIIMRGISGSGKSTLAKQISQGGIILSTDEFFMVNGSYQFDRSLLGKAHNWNQERARQALNKGISPIVIDNTNTTWREIQPYFSMAKDHGYDVSFAEPDTPWKFDAKELAKRNTHGVPAEVIQNMIDRWQPTETFGLDKKAAKDSSNLMLTR